jgi:diguanylate cyclase (GGDEF)-like protein
VAFTLSTLYQINKQSEAVFLNKYPPVLQLQKLHKLFEQDLPQLLINYESEHITSKKTTKQLGHLLKSVQQHWLNFKHITRNKEILKRYDQKFVQTVVWLSSMRKRVESGEPLYIDAIIDYIATVEASLLAIEKLEVQKAYQLFIHDKTVNTTLLVIISLIIAFVVLTVLAFLLFNTLVHDQKQLTSLNNLLAIAHEKNKQLSIIDPLTQLHNRRYFQIHFKQIVKKSVRQQHDMTLISFEIDQFDHFNILYGYSAGDNLIKTIAAFVREHFRRPTDYAFRLDGNQFGIILENLSKEESKTLAKNFVKEVYEAGIVFDHDDAIDQRVTISVGLCMANPPKDSSNDGKTIMRRADDARHMAKAKGGNITHSFSL